MYRPGIPENQEEITKLLYSRRPAEKEECTLQPNNGISPKGTREGHESIAQRPRTLGSYGNIQEDKATIVVGRDEGDN
jgi:hypothetical protein